jgi:hypothetical protein
MTKKIISLTSVHRHLLLFLCCACVGLIPTATPAQIRLHDPINDELARKSRDAFKEFSNADANVFDTMINNTLALKTATLNRLRELNRQASGDKINQLPLMTWAEFLTEVEDTQKGYLNVYKSAHAILDEAMGQPPDPALQNATDLKTALAAARKKLESLQKTRDDKQVELNATAPKLDELKKSLDKLKDEIGASTQPIKHLSDLSEFSHLEAVWSTVKDLKDWFEMAKKASNTPGLQLTLLEMGVQHQQAEVERIKLQIEKSDSAAKILERMDKRLTSVWGSGELDKDRRLSQGLFKQIYANIDPACETGCPPSPQRFVNSSNSGEQILVTIGKLAKLAHGEVGTELVATTQLRDLLDVLGRYVTLVGYQKYLLLADAVEAGTDTQLFAIRLSALNTKDREALVSNGLDGLAAYHSGGLKPEQIANFFRAAQSIALGVLAGRVE